MFAGINGDRLVVGYDLTNTCSQISYCYLKKDGSEAEAETLASVAGEENYDIPTVLCKRRGTNQWLFGKEAVRYVKEYPDEGILIDNLLKQAIEGENIRIEGKSYKPISLLTLFVKRSLGLLSGIGSADKITALMFTCEELTAGLVDVLGQLSLGLGLKNTRIYFQNYGESFYNYMLYQPTDLWRFQTVLFDYRKEQLKCRKMTCNEKTMPVVVYVEEEVYPFAGTDEELLHISWEAVENSESRTSAVYLIGEKFAGDWMKESLRYLCAGRRVFQGNNLYSKGACFSLAERLQGSENGAEHVYLGSEKLKANIGMKVFKRGEETYHALLDGGENWYETEYTCELYLQEEAVLEFIITPLIGGERKRIRMPLEGLGLKEGETTRIRIHLYMTKENVLCTEVSDLGFGQFRMPTEAKWKEEMVLY